MTATGKTFEEVLAPNGCVAVEPRFYEPFMAYAQLGRDFNGSLLVADGRAWLDENGIDDPGERGYFWRCWRDMEAERGDARREEEEVREAERKMRG